MTITQLLAQDHARLRKDMAEIRRKMPNGSILKREIDKFIRDLELHETIEMRFLVTPATLSPIAARIEELTARIETEHHEIWDQVGKFVELSKHNDLSELKSAYSYFLNLAEMHIKLEEEILFPMVTEYIDILTLEELGREAEKYLQRFRQESGSAEVRS